MHKLRDWGMMGYWFCAGPPHCEDETLFRAKADQHCSLTPYVHEHTDCWKGNLGPLFWNNKAVNLLLWKM